MSDVQSARWREGTEWYTCDMCGTHYPRRLVAIQNGRIRCFGPETHDCWEEPGIDAYRRDLEPNYEEPPAPLPDYDEDL